MQHPHVACSAVVGAAGAHVVPAAPPLAPHPTSIDEEKQAGESNGMRPRRRFFLVSKRIGVEGDGVACG